MRRLTIFLASAIVGAAPAFSADPGAGPGRYALGPSSDGFVRLDTATGSVSHCVQTNGVWRCEPLAQEDGAIQSRLDALSAEVKRLSAAVAALDARVASLAPVVAPPVQAGDETPGPAERNLAQQVVGRFLDMVRRLKQSADSSPG